MGGHVARGYRMQFCINEAFHGIRERLEADWDCLRERGTLSQPKLARFPDTVNIEKVGGFGRDSIEKSRKLKTKQKHIRLTQSANPDLT